ncbi:T9SS type A sorting domain-containing protein [Flavobacterium mekongense]|uniref:T9SS type A sorting domain-containing protein n=1 Tax=Flavobacterium mekongense TaxID=3379707 RepID=UPI00399ACD0C
MKKIFTWILLATFVISFGQNYGLDSSYGNNGRIVHTSISNTPIKVYFVNNYYFLINYNNSVVCLNYDGTINTSFGTEGVLTFNSGNLSYLVKGSKLIGNYFYIFGQIENSVNKNGFIAKVSTSGTFDTGFGVNGVLTQDFGQDEVINDLLILNNGQLLCVGSRYQSSSNMILSRYNQNGTIDSAFDTNGYKALTISQSNTNSGANIFNFNNNYLVVGKSFYNENSGSYFHHDLVLINLDVNGSYITSFGNGGVIKSALAGNSLGNYTVFNATLVNNNELFFSQYYGFSFTTQINSLRKYNFNTNSITDIKEMPFSYPFYSLETNQKIYITGTERCGSTTTSNCPRNFNLYRTDWSGNSDATFNGTGSFSYNFFPSDLYSDDRGSVVFLHDDGKIFMAGYGYNPYSTNGTGLETIRLMEGGLNTYENDFQNDFFIYPNPSAEELNIVIGYNEVKEVKVLDLFGKEVLVFKGNVDRLNIKTLQKGLYVVQINTGNEVYSKKFIKE